MRQTRIFTLAMTLVGTTALALTAQAGPGHSSLPEALPPSSNPGECWARVKIPAQYETRREGVVAEEGYTKLDVRQPVLQSRQEQVMVKEPSTKFVVRQPQYRRVTEQIMTRPAYDKLSVSQPQFSMVEERMQTSAPHLVWKKGNPGELRRQGYRIHSTADGRAQNSSNYQGSTQSDQSAFYGAGLGGQPCGANCEIWCLVEEPGESTSVRRRVMTSPGQVTRTPVPAKYKTLHKQVVSDPGGVDQILVPAEYQSITIEDIVDPGGVYDNLVAPTYASVETKTLISPERYEWRRVVCQPGTGTIGGGYSSSYSSPTYSSQAYSSPAHSTSSYSSETLSGGSYPTSTSHRSAPSHYTGPEAERIIYPQGTQQSYNTRTGYYGEDEYPAYRERRQRMTIKNDTGRKAHRPRR